jgi:hypothetical protein
MGSVGLPPKIVVPIVLVFAVVFLGIMGYFLRIGFGTTGAAFGPQAGVREQGDARIAATPVPESGPTDPPGTVDIPQSGTGPVAGNPPLTSGDASNSSSGAPGPASGPNALPPGNATGGGGPPAPVMQILSQLKARVAKNPRDIAALVELGNLYFDASKFDQAAGYYKSALALDPSNPEVRNDDAAALHASGHDLEALNEVDRVLAERPNFPQALFNRGIVLGSMGRRSDAIVAYREFLKVAPNDQHAADAQAAIKELAR